MGEFKDEVRLWQITEEIKTKGIMKLMILLKKVIVYKN